MHRLRARLAVERLRVAREERMTLQGKHSRNSSESPPEKQAKQHRPYESPCESPHYVPNEEQDVQPSRREIEAANAARERLYGSSREGQAVEVAEARLPTGAEPSATIEVEYVATADLQPFEAAEADSKAALADCRSSDWSTVCSGLLGIRRLATHHGPLAKEHMTDVMACVLKSIKSLRSSVSKMAVMAAADLVAAFGDELLPYFDLGGAAKPAGSVLSQLLLKGSSNDKRFVIDEVQRTLELAAENFSPALFLEKLLPYTAHRNPKVRGTTATVVAAAAGRLAEDDWNKMGIAHLLKLAAKLLSDNTPEARGAAKKLTATLYAAYKQQAEEKENARAWGTPVNSPRGGEGCEAREGEKGSPNQLAHSWESQCRACLGPAQATAIFKITGHS